MAHIYRLYKEVNNVIENPTVDQLLADDRAGGMIWSIFPRPNEFEGDTGIDLVDVGTDAPEGQYEVEFRGHRAWGVTVENGMFDTDKTLEAVNDARQMSGYWGLFLEGLTYDPNERVFHASIGS